MREELLLLRGFCCQVHKGFLSKQKEEKQNKKMDHIILFFFKRADMNGDGDGLGKVLGFFFVDPKPSIIN